MNHEVGRGFRACPKELLEIRIFILSMFCLLNREVKGKVDAREEVMLGTTKKGILSSTSSMYPPLESTRLQPSSTEFLISGRYCISKSNSARCSRQRVSLPQESLRERRQRGATWSERTVKRVCYRYGRGCKIAKTTAKHSFSGAL
jgi:hypothetical protein